MKAEEFTERKQIIDGWNVNVVTYRIGDRWYCTIDNVDPGARFARAEGTTREDVPEFFQRQFIRLRGRRLKARGSVELCSSAQRPRQ